ncbi:uncharacterized protein TNCV_4665051 [Trichonephila clavipes]|nr:uncharacterized protein TNCV_4665051 [Trichonephila clavipes]
MGLVKEYKENEDIRNVCRMISALAYLPIEHIDDAWSIVWKNAFSIDKAHSLIILLSSGWTIQICSLRYGMYMDSIIGHILFKGGIPNYATTGRNQPNVHLLVKILKEETQNVSFNLKSRELGEP